MKKTFFLLLLTYCYLVSAETLEVSQLDELFKLPSHEIDINQYAYTTLHNGLNVLLISNRYYKNEIQLKVQAGGHNDPKEFPGIAHLLEHLVHLGSKGYPNLHGYRNFVERNNGKIAATTRDTNTVYELQLGSRHFEKGVKRFADMIINPILSKNVLAKEINAVHSEYELKKTFPEYLIARVHRETQFAGLQPSRFLIGNAVSLPASQLDSIHQQVKTFYKEYYHAKNMFLILRSKLTIEESLALVKETFGKFAATTSPTPSTLELQNNLQQKIRINTPDNQPSLILQFPLSHHVPFFSNRAYLAKAFFDPKDPKSLNSIWKNNGWINNAVVATDMTESVEYPAIGFRLLLTDTGVTQQRKILQEFFGYTNQLKIALASENKQTELVSRIEEVEKKGKFFMKSIADLMKNFGQIPVEHLLFRDPYSQPLLDFISELNPQNLRLWEINLGSKTDQATDFDNVPYDIEKISNDNIVSMNSTYKDFAIPYLSLDDNSAKYLKYWQNLGFAFKDISEDQDELPEDIEPSIKTSGAVSVWTYSPWISNVHSIKMRLRSVSKPNQKSYLLRQIWFNTVAQRLGQIFNDHCPRSDVNTCELKVDPYGNLLMSFSSNRERLPEVLTMMENAISSIYLTGIKAKEFAKTKEHLIGLKNIGAPFGVSQEIFNMALLTGDLNISGETRDPLLRSLTWEDLKQFESKFLKTLQPEFLFESSVTEEFAAKFAKHIASKYKTKIASEYKESEAPAFDITDNTVISLVSLHRTPSHSQFFVGKNVNYKDVVYSHVIAEQLKTAFHNEMRTEQQLGYVASVQIFEHFNRPILAFYAQHDSDADNVVQRINHFQRQFAVALRNTDIKTINSWIRNTVQKLSPTKKQHHWLLNGHADKPETFLTEEELNSFNVNKHKAAELIQFYDEMISVNGWAKFEISSKTKNSGTD